MLNESNIAALRERLGGLPAHLLQILDGAVMSFSQTGNTLRFTNTATGLRELLREIFSAISPDQEVMKCSWFAPEDPESPKVTRRDRTLFAVYSYLDPRHFPTDFVQEVDALASSIKKQVDSLSKFTHVTAKILATPPAEAIRLFDRAVESFLGLFAAIDSAREHLHDALQVELQDKLTDIFTCEFFDDLDILSTHTRPESAEDVTVTIWDIAEDKISFKGTGRVLCNIQYGSDGDCRRGDGLEFMDSYPFTFSGEAETADPNNVDVATEDVLVDTSSFYE